MILHQIRLARPADQTNFADITPARLDGPARWIECEQHGGDCLDLPFDALLTAAQKSALRRRLITADAADEQRLSDLLSARENAAPGSFERLWLDTEIGKYEPLTYGTGV